MIRPPRLAAGAAVSVVAPSGPVPRDRFLAGAAILSARYRLVYDDSTLFGRDGFLSGSDDVRLSALEHALLDPATSAVLCARGGYGLTRILSRLSPALLSDGKKPIVGFSDITALHAARLRHGVVPIHGPVITQLADLDVTDIEALYAMLEDPAPAPAFGDLIALTRGVAQGPLIGGNLEVLTRLLGTQALPDLNGAILLIEEIGERPYRLDRQLTHLEAAGVFQKIAGIAVGELVRCTEPDGSGPDASEVFAERLGRLKLPVVLGLPVGHGARNRAVALGARVEIDADIGRFTPLEGAVS